MSYRPPRLYSLELSLIHRRGSGYVSLSLSPTHISESGYCNHIQSFEKKTLILVCAWICIAELAIALLGYEVKFIIKPHHMVDNSFTVMNLLFILWSPLSANSSAGSLFDPRGSGRREQFPAQRPLWISWTSRRRRIVSIEIATSAWQAGLNYQPRCSPLLTTNLICIVTTHQHSSPDYFFLLSL